MNSPNLKRAGLTLARMALITGASFVIVAFVLGIAMNCGVVTIPATTSEWALGILSYCAFSCLVAAGVSGAYLHIYILKPLEALSQGIERVGEGDLGAQLDEQEANTVIDTYLTFNQMSRNLSDVMTQHEQNIAYASHEFKQPLARIQGSATMLQFEDISPEERTEYVKRILDDTHFLSNLVNRALELSELSETGKNIPVQRYRLDEQLRLVLADAIPQLEQRGIAYEVDLQNVLVEANEAMMSQVWSNLIANAAQFTPAGGTISVSLRERDAHAIVAVRDTGRGMTEEEMGHIFERFYCVDHPDLPRGSGLGLAISQAIVEKHSGSISVESSPGAGSCFTVELPLEFGVETPQRQAEP